MLKGKQKKLDRNNNNKIDSEDFKLLRGTKKGMRMGGEVKPMKAALGAIAMGALGAAAAKKFFKKKKSASPVLDKVTEKKKELLTGAAKSGGMIKKKKVISENPMKEERFQQTRQAAIAKVIGKENVGDPRKVERPSKKNKKMGGGMMKMGYRRGGTPSNLRREQDPRRTPGPKAGRPFVPGPGGQFKKKKSDKGGGADMSKVPNARGRLRDAIKKFQRERMNAKEMIPLKSKSLKPLKSKSGGAINKKGKPRKVVGILGFKGKAKDYPGALKLLNMKKNLIKK